MIAIDDEGLDLPNVDAARLQALIGARGMIAEQVRHGYMVRSHWIDVLDEGGAVVLTLSFREAVDIKD